MESRDQRMISDIMFNLFSLRRPSDFKKENSTGECGELLVFSVDVCFCANDLHSLEIEAQHTGPWGGLEPTVSKQIYANTCAQRARRARSIF